MTPQRSANGLIHAAFHQPETRVYHVTQAVVWFLIVLSVLLFGVELFTEYGLDGTGFVIIDQVILVLFSLEIGARVLSFRPPELDFFHLSPTQRVRRHVMGRLRYLLKPMNLLDLLSVLALVKELRGFRALRLLRLIQGSTIFRYSTPFASIGRAFADNQLLFWFALSLLGAEVLIGGVTVYLAERDHNIHVTSLADGFWWALVTLTTVGFGDITPVSAIGRAMGAVLMVGGMFTLALFAGIVGHTLVSSLLALREEHFRMSNYVDHVVICGYSPGARVLLDTIRGELPAHTQVVIFAAGDRDPEVPAEFIWVPGDPTKESELDKVRLTHAACVVVIGSHRLLPQQADAVTLMTLFTVRSYLDTQPMNKMRRHDLYLVAEILEQENISHARAAGANEVVQTTRLGYSLVARAVAMPGTAQIVSQVATQGASSVYVDSCPSSWDLPMNFGELAVALKEAHNAMLIGLRDPHTGHDDINPPLIRAVTKNMKLIYLADSRVLAEHTM